jgi:hypothetical protein
MVRSLCLTSQEEKDFGDPTKAESSREWRKEEPERRSFHDQDFCVIVGLMREISAGGTVWIQSSKALLPCGLSAGLGISDEACSRKSVRNPLSRCLGSPYSAALVFGVGSTAIELCRVARPQVHQKAAG